MAAIPAGSVSAGPEGTVEQQAPAGHRNQRSESAFRVGDPSRRSESAIRVIAETPAEASSGDVTDVAELVSFRAGDE